VTDKAVGISMGISPSKTRMLSRPPRFDLEDNADDDQAGRLDMSESDLQVASQIIVLVNQRRSNSEETVGTCSAGNTEDALCNWIQLKAVNVLFVAAWT